MMIKKYLLYLIILPMYSYAVLNISIPTSMNTMAIILPTSMNFFNNKSIKPHVISWMQMRSISKQDMDHFIATLFAYLYMFTKKSSIIHINLQSSCNTMEEYVHAILNYMIYIYEQLIQRQVYPPENFIRILTKEHIIESAKST